MNEKVRFSLKTGELQILEFTIDGLLEPSDLRSIQIVEIDPSKPLVLSGRGPQWFYGFLVHHYHFARILATYEPRANVGVIVYSVNERDVGLGMDVETGSIREIKLGADGRIETGLIKLGTIQILRSELVEGAFAEPSELRKIKWWDLKKAVDPSKPIIVYVMAPIWVTAKIAVEFSNLVPWIAIYDPKLESSIIVARHSPEAPRIGQQIKLKTELIEE